jgi:Ala-tRNA(Pro) deacylase
MIPTKTEADIYQFLADNQIHYLRYEHPPVYTCDEASLQLPDAPGAATKNLLLTSPGSNRYYLLVAAGEKRIHFKKLGKILGEKKLHFAREMDLINYLGVNQGAVTLLGIINDWENRVMVIIDSDLKQAQALQCHPLVNTATLVISLNDLVRFLSLVNHLPVFISGFTSHENSQ